MFVLEALFPDGWREQGTAKLEYWACQEAQIRCCADGRNYRIIDHDTRQIVALVDTSSCRLPDRRSASRAGAASSSIQP